MLCCCAVPLLACMHLYVHNAVYKTIDMWLPQTNRMHLHLGLAYAMV